MRLQADHQTGFAKALLATAGPEPLVPEGLGPEAEARFAVYRNNVQHGLSKVLAQRYPVIETLLGAESFLALARLFLAVEPPASPMLFAWGAGLPRFLGSLPDLAGWPFLADVARLEWARGLAWHAADADPVPAQRLAAAAQRPDAVRFRLHSSVQVLRTRHAAFSIWAAHQAGGSLEGLDPMQPEATLVLRDPQDRIVTEPLAAGDAAMLAALARGRTLLIALTDAGPRHDPGPLFLRLVRHGAITEIEGDLP